MVNFLLGELFPLPVGVNSPGREKYDGLEAGGEVAASEFNKGGYTADGLSYGLGGRKLNQQEQKSLEQEFVLQEDFDYQHSSSIAQLTSFEHPKSLASRFIAAMSSSVNQIPRMLFTSIPITLNNLVNLNQPAYAAALLSESPFGVVRFGYTLDDPALTMDPAEMTEQFCAQAKDKWLKSMKEDPLTGFDEYYVTNPCLLEEAAVEAGSGAYTEANISIGFNSDVVIGSAQDLAKKILSYKGSKYSCDNPGDCNDLEYTASGKSLMGVGTCRADAIDVKVLQIILTLIEKHNMTVGTYALCSDHESNAAKSRHNVGFAVDISSLNSKAINSSSSYNETLYVMKWLNSLIGTPLAPDQVLNQGTGSYSEELDNLSMNNHQNSPKYTSREVGGHMDHIHIGY